MEETATSKGPADAAPPVTDFLASAAWRKSLSDVRYYLTVFAHKVDEPAAGRTPLLWAISAGRDDAMKLFLAKGADITKKTADGDTALACAVWSGSAKMVRLMLDKGLNPAAKNSQGKTALDWARETDQPDIAALLEEPTRAAVTAVRQHDLNMRARQKKFRVEP